MKSPSENRVVLDEALVATSSTGMRDREQEIKEHITVFLDYLKQLARQQLGGNLADVIRPSEVASQAVTIAFQKARSFHGEGDTTRRVCAWLQRILAYQIQSARREYFLRTQWEVQGDGLLTQVECEDPSVDSQLQLDQRDLILRKAIEDLPQHYQNVLRWRFWDALGYKVIGERLGISADAARHLGGRALLALKSRLGSTFDPI